MIKLSKGENRHRQVLACFPPYSTSHSSIFIPIPLPMPLMTSHPTLILHLPDLSIMSPVPIRIRSLRLAKVARAIPMSPSGPGKTAAESTHSVLTASKIANSRSKIKACAPSNLRDILRCLFRLFARAALGPGRRRLRPLKEVEKRLMSCRTAL